MTDSRDMIGKAQNEYDERNLASTKKKSAHFSSTYTNIEKIDD